MHNDSTARRMHEQRFEGFDAFAALNRLAHEQGRADLLAIAALMRSDGAPVHFYAAAWARDLGISPRTVARQLRACPEVGYVPGRGRQGSLVCAPLSEDGYSRQRSLFDDLSPALVDNPVDDGGGSVVSATVLTGAACGPEIEERSDSIDTPLGPDAAGAGVDGAGPVLAGLAADLVATGRDLYPDAPGGSEEGWCSLLATLEDRLAPVVGDRLRALSLAHTVALAGLFHAAGPGDRAFRWGPLLLADPERYGTRPTFLRALALGWGTTVDGRPTLTEAGRRTLRAAFLGRTSS